MSGSNGSWGAALMDLPILAVCGWSGSGKTTVLERILPRLRAEGLHVAVIKRDAHGLEIDHPGKDSDRFFQAGADVLMQGEGERFFREHPQEGEEGERALVSLARRFDLLLVEGYKNTPLPKIWLLSEGENAPPADVGGVLATLRRGRGRSEEILSLLKEWLPTQWRKTPLYGCVLIGGKSRRMGSPKHLIEKDGKTWLERTVGLLSTECERVVISGAGKIPETLKGHPRLPDVPDTEGPVSGLLSVMRWAPRASWLISACDLPDLTPETLRWLASTRSPGVWATLPRLGGNAIVQPLLAHYDFRARLLLEDLAAKGGRCAAGIASSPKVTTPCPPRGLWSAWRNVNEPASLLVRGDPGCQGTDRSRNVPG